MGSLITRAVVKRLAIVNGLLLVGSLVTFGTSHRTTWAWVGIGSLGAFVVGLILVLREVQSERVEDRKKIEPVRRVMEQGIKHGDEILRSGDYGPANGWYTGIFNELTQKDSRVAAERFANTSGLTDGSAQARHARFLANLKEMFAELP